MTSSVSGPPHSSSSTSATSYNGSGFIPRLGLGANIRVSGTFAIQPEFTGYYNIDSSAVVFTAGLGFLFGSQPDFSDIQ